MLFQAAKITEFERIRDFYWNLIDRIYDQNDTIGWKKGIYPADSFLWDSLSKGQLYTLKDGETLCACVILNHSCNEGYDGVPWRINCQAHEVLIPHALAVSPALQGCGLGKLVINEVLHQARRENKKAVRLDVLGTNQTAERLYRSVGFEFVQAKMMFYEDTGWTEYKMFEFRL